MEDQKKEEILKVFKGFWHTWARRENRSKTIKDIIPYFNKNITAIGTGEHERGRNYIEVVKNFTDDFNELKTSIDLNFNWINTNVLSNNSGFVEAELTLKIDTDEDITLNFTVRLTTILKETEGRWKIIHNHASIPSDGQNIGESYPLDKLRAKNNRLHQQVLERTKEIENQKTALRKEKEKTEKLLFNILPKIVAKELLLQGSVKPKIFKNVSILFTDFIGFTQVSKEVPPEKLIRELNDLFYHFDEVVKDENLEKIKTIGDSYMAVCGLPEPNNDHAHRCIGAAKKMLNFLEKRNKENIIDWKMRIGIHSGSVIAGVVGNHKFSYDLWGDTVNTASRLESSGQQGRVNISKQTYNLIKGNMDCQSRGKIKIKGGNEIDMYFVL